jgi:hypothetical protein
MHGQVAPRAPPGGAAPPAFFNLSSGGECGRGRRPAAACVRTSRDATNLIAGQQTGPSTTHGKGSWVGGRRVDAQSGRRFGLFYMCISVCRRNGDRIDSARATRCVEGAPGARACFYIYKSCHNMNIKSGKTQKRINFIVSIIIRHHF